jgi:hypothetical protein
MQWVPSSPFRVQQSITSISQFKPPVTPLLYTRLWSYSRFMKSVLPIMWISRVLLHRQVLRHNFSFWNTTVDTPVSQPRIFIGHAIRNRTIHSTERVAMRRRDSVYWPETSPLTGCITSNQRSLSKYSKHTAGPDEKSVTFTDVKFLDILNRGKKPERDRKKWGVGAGNDYC